MCRASDLAKERKKLSKAERWEGKPKDRARVEQSRVESSRYCGRKHERNKQNCRALGKRVLNCNKLNHFPAQCLTTKRNDDRGLLQRNAIANQSLANLQRLIMCMYNEIHVVSHECFS